MQKELGPLTVVCVANATYLAHLTVLVRSARRTVPAARIHAHLINVSDADAASVAVLGAEVTRETVTGLDPTPYGPLWAHCAKTRAFEIEKCLARGDPYVVYFDADAIIRRSLVGLVHLLDHCDGMILSQKSVHTVSGGERDRFAAGAIAFRNTPAARRFVARWVEKIRAYGDVWTVEQVCFSHTYDELGGEVSIKPLPFRFIDWKLSLGSPVWIGKGPVIDSRMYQLEVKRVTEQPSSLVGLVITLEQVVLRVRRALWELKNFTFFILGTLRRRLFPRTHERDHE